MTAFRIYKLCNRVPTEDGERHIPVGAAVVSPEDQEVKISFVEHEDADAWREALAFIRDPETLGRALEDVTGQNPLLTVREEERESDEGLWAFSNRVLDEVMDAWLLYDLEE